ncbi:MAG TPA: hypothetical protein PK843_06925 [bacterium]|nr:hypothetical protein [bacterium]HPN34226.1 hypothetical protein [bacterium]
MTFTKMVKIVAIMACSGGWTGAHSQQVNVSARMINPSLRAFFLSDFNFTGSGTSGASIFSVTLTNTGLMDEPCDLTLTMRSENLGELAEGRTNTFTLRGPSSVALSSQNLFSQTHVYHLEDYSIARAGDELKNRILATGKLPSDIYYFRFTLRQLRTGFTSQTEISLRVDNPNTLDILAPGSRAGSDDPAQVFTTLPLFRWDSNLDKFRLRIAEKLPELHKSASPEEIMNDRVRFDRTFQLNRDPSAGATPGLEVIASTAYQYPAAGVWPLERGKTYYWQIIGLGPSSGGEIEMPGEIWCFTIAQPIAGMRGANSALMNQLALLLGDQLASLMTGTGPLAGYQPTGVFSVNGHSYTLDQLLALLAALNRGEYVVTGTMCQ